MDHELKRIVEERLERSALSDEAALMVLAALEGSEALSDLLAGSNAERVREDVESSQVPSRAYLSEITVEGFRGIGQRATLKLEANPGLTLVVGRNGSGKSSFAEGLEILLTGENRRWSERSAIWKEGWRNLHHGDEVTVEATFQVEGHPGPTVISRTWRAADEIGDGAATAQHHGKPRGALAALGWSGPLAAYRPFLSYNELGSMLDEGPTKLYDALSAILGLEDLVDAQKTLQQARLSRTKATKELLRERDGSLLPQLAELEDSRAESARNALEASPLDLEALEALIVPSEGADSVAPELGVLAELASIRAPDLGDISEVAADLRAAAEAIDRVSGTDSALARDTLDLLSSALEFRDEHDPSTCPVCEAGVLNGDWAARTRERIARFKQAAAEAEAADDLARTAIDRLGQILTQPPPVLAEAENAGLDATEVAVGWRRLVRDAPAELVPCADHIEAAALELIEVVGSLVESARREHSRLEDSWRPIATILAAFVGSARKAVAGESRVKDLKSAEDWLKGALAAIRDERFAPIAEQSTDIWEMFESQSHVELAHVELAGAAGRRRVVLDVRVDGMDGAALGVMSQGELNALALSLFLPRATLPESPFGMVVIDDPVQAMDPARVDGLARVLSDVAVVRQVVVFTHDDRLPESVRRLGIDAHIIEVVRREGSVVELREALDPVSRYLEDARALVRTEDLPDQIASRVVPGFCRLALEAACDEVTRRRRISRGDPHTDVELLLQEARKLSQRSSLALFDDPTRGGDVLRRLNQISVEAGDAYKECNRGVHEPVPVASLPGLIVGVEKLVQQLRDLR